MLFVGQGFNDLANGNELSLAIVQAVTRLAKVLGVARQTVLHKVQRGELDAVHVNQGRRKGLRINVNTKQDGLFDQPR